MTTPSATNSESIQMRALRFMRVYLEERGENAGRAYAFVNEALNTPVSETAPTCQDVIGCRQGQPCVHSATRPIGEVTIPLADALSEPCKGCGKRPLDFMVGGVT